MDSITKHVQLCLGFVEATLETREEQWVQMLSSFSSDKSS
jgi:hypothetical protein